MYVFVVVVDENCVCHHNKDQESKMLVVVKENCPFYHNANNFSTVVITTNSKRE